MIHKVYILIFLNILFTYTACENEQAVHQIDPHTDHNIEHLKEDLEGVIEKKPEEMSTEELQFHYFHQHDYDKDNNLDGNEIVMSLLHHSKDSPEGANPFGSDEQMMTIVDDVLKQQDKNDDGKISFQEYIAPFQQAADKN